MDTMWIQILALDLIQLIGADDQIFKKSKRVYFRKKHSFKNVHHFYNMPLLIGMDVAHLIVIITRLPILSSSDKWFRTSVLHTSNCLIRYHVQGS